MQRYAAARTPRPEQRVRFNDRGKKKRARWTYEQKDKFICTGTLLMLALVLTITMITSGSLSALLGQTRAAAHGHSGSVTESGSSAGDYIIAQD